jgi:hypothetical protein
MNNSISAEFKRVSVRFIKVIAVETKFFIFDDRKLLFHAN